MNSKLAPSMMCADLLSLGDTLRAFEADGVEYLHIDIMDGSFVPNFTLGTDYCRRLKACTSIPLDIHLMVERPEEKLSWFPMDAGDYVSVHVESTRHLQRTLAGIRARGARPMVALNPATPLCMIEHVLPDVDAVLLMTVNPGYAGQKLIPQMLDKIATTREFLDERGFSHVEIEVDGNVSFENAKKMRAAGANIFVAGTASIFSAERPMGENLCLLREAVK